jgi:hypothetical protein
VQFAYSIPLGTDDTITLEQKMPAQLTQVSVVAQKIGASDLSSPQLATKREMPAEGQHYILGQGGAIKAGDTLTLTLTGLPHRPAWPRNIALLLSAVIIGAGIWGTVRGTVSPRLAARRGQLQTRREKLYADLAALEAQRRAGSVNPSAYASRRADLVTSLEGVYAELE